MAQKLWEKNVQVDHEVDIFTVGKDREMDIYLAKYDVLGSMAHITMLESIGLLAKDELSLLLAELKNIYVTAEKGEFVIEEGVEDVHSHHRGRHRGCALASGTHAYTSFGRYGQEDP